MRIFQRLEDDFGTLAALAGNDKKMALVLTAQAAQGEGTVGAARQLLRGALENRTGHRLALHIENTALDNHAHREKKVFAAESFSRLDLDGLRFFFQFGPIARDTARHG